MSRVSGLSNSEIAEQLAISKRTVETQISNALKVLREKLEI
jgi:RNA polymerase sigma-70 factor (ECF subfamily)